MFEKYVYAHVGRTPASQTPGVPTTPGLDPKTVYKAISDEMRWDGSGTGTTPRGSSQITHTTHNTQHMCQPASQGSTTGKRNLSGPIDNRFSTTQLQSKICSDLGIIFPRPSFVSLSDDVLFFVFASRHAISKNSTAHGFPAVLSLIFPMLSFRLQLSRDPRQNGRAR